LLALTFSNDNTLTRQHNTTLSGLQEMSISPTVGPLREALLAINGHSIDKSYNAEMGIS